MSSKNALAPHALMLLLCFHIVMPWLHGGERIWELGLGGLIASLGLFVWLLQKDDFKATPAFNYLMALALLYFTYINIYLLPVSLDATVIPTLHKSNILSIPIQHFHTLSKIDTTISNVHTAALILLFVLTFSIFKRVSNIKIVFRVIVFSALAICVYGWLNFITNGAYAFVKPIPPWGSDWKTTIAGTFSYKNQFAMYLGMVFFTVLGYCADAKLKNKSNKKIIIALMVAIFILFTLLQANSRGVVICIIAMCPVLAFLFIKKLKLTKSGKVLVKKKWLLACSGVVAVGIIILSGASSVQRFSSYGLGDNGRIQLHKVAIDVIKLNPLTGVGPGAYSQIQHAFKPPSLGSTEMSIKAHNDYLEFMATHGILGLVFLLAFFVLLYKYVLKAANKRYPFFLLGCKASIVLLMVHSIFDFNFSLLYLSALYLSLIAACLRLDDRYHKLAYSSRDSL